MQAETMSMREVAEALGMTYDWFSRAREELVKEHGFPKPLSLPRLNSRSGQKSPGRFRWSTARVMTWINNGQQSAIRTPPPPTGSHPVCSARLDELL